MYKVTLIKGDGIGPEIADSVIKILECAKAPIEWDVHYAGKDVMEKEGVPLPQRVIDSIKKNKVALKAPVTTPIGTGFKSVNVQLRQALDLYANVRPAKNIKGIKTPFNDVDLVVIRENTEDLYKGVEEKISDDEIHGIKVITRHASERIIEFAFDYAIKNNRKCVTAVTKANICKMADGLFLECARDVAKNYKGKIEYNEVLVDSLCMQLVLNPSKFDVLVLPNLYGDIVSDLTSGLIGGLGVAKGANIGEDYAIFEPVHGSAPDIKGKNLANPTALLFCACDMLRYLEEEKIASKIESAIYKVIECGKTLTKDLGGCATTDEFTDEIIKNL